MADLPETRPSLLLRLRDPKDAAAWTTAVAVYGPAVYRFARGRGLQDADAADVMQDVLRSLTQAVGGLTYDPTRGSFRSWLFTLAHRRLYDHLARARRQVAGSGDTDTIAVLQEQPAPDDAARAWDDEWEKARFAWAADRVREQVTPDTWEAFRATAVGGETPRAVADRLGLTVASVYLARSRVMARLREVIESLGPD